MPTLKTASTSQSPHDAFAKAAFGRIAEARALFRAYLPPDVAGVFDWRTLRQEKESFLSDSLGPGFADLRFSVCLVGDDRPRRITLLFEHKYRPKYTTLRQLFRYLSRQFEETAEKEPLPSIVTVVLLQSGTWNRSPMLSSEYDLPDEALAVLAPYLVNFRMALVQLSGLDEAALKGTEAGRFAMALLKAVGEGSPFGWLRYRTVLRDVCRLPSDALSRLMRQAFHYLASVTKPEQKAEVREVITSIPREFGPIKENMMTLLEHLQEEGRQEGLKEGRQEGLQEGLQEGVCKNLIDILSRMFPEFSASHARRVRNASDELLEQLQNAIVERQSWADVRRLLRGR